MSNAALIDLAERPMPASSAPITATMLKAGRAAFMRERRNLSDLFDFFDADRDQFIVAIYRSMAAANGR